jgi:regulator of protease activity HflC (stomatin/prohibitin superfamily)
VVVWIAIAAKIIPENQRIVIYRLDRFLGVKGPGLILTLPLVDKVVRVALGAVGVLTQDETMSIHGQEVLVHILDQSVAGQTVSIEGFEDEVVLVSLAPNQEAHH